VTNNNIEPMNRQGESGPLYKVFSIWIFILLCRPQDYLPLLGTIRPGLTLGLLTLLLFISNPRKRANLSNNEQFRLYRYLIALMIVGVPFSLYKSASLKDVFDYASITTLFFFLFYQLVDSVDRVRNLLFMSCCGVAVYALYIMKFGSFDEGRISFGNMFDPNDIAYYIISFLTFNFLFMGKSEKGKIRLIAALNVVVSLIVILKTGSRGGFVALIATLCYMLFAKTSSINISFATKSAIILLALVSMQFAAINSDRYKTILDLEDDYNVTGEEGRIEIWKKGMKLMFTHPLTGVGMNRFNEGIGRERDRLGLVPKWQTAHNSAVQIGAETGIFGLVLFCLMSFNVFRITRHIMDKSQNGDLVRISEMTRAGFIGHFVSAMFLSQAYSIYWAFYIVLSAVLIQLHKNEIAYSVQVS
jgi:O-antigen ligase